MKRALINGKYIYKDIYVLGPIFALSIRWHFEFWSGKVWPAVSVLS